MRIKKNGRIIRLSESDLKRIVKRVLTEDAPLPGREHRKEIEDFLSCPTDQRLKDRMRKRLQNDAYSKQTKIDTNIGKGTKGEVKIIFNGRKDMRNVDAFIDEMIADYESRLERGKEKACKKIKDYTYKNKALGKTTIDIKTDGYKKCDCKEEPKKEEPKKKVKPETGSGGKQESDCEDPAYLRNTLKYGGWFEAMVGGDPVRFWEVVIPKMGSSKKAMCACWMEIDPRKLTQQEDEAVYELCVSQKDKSIEEMPPKDFDDDDDHSLIDDLRDRIGF
jgi:DNA-binding protein YbaB